VSVPGPFPLMFGWATGITVPADTALTYLGDHCGDGQQLLLSQFKDSTNLKALLCALLDGVQDFDNACWQVLTERGLENAVGVQLDGIGQIVGLSRAGWTDAVYRKLLGAQTLVLRSRGRWQDLSAIMAALDVNLTVTELIDLGLAAFRIFVTDQPIGPDITAHDVFNMIVAAKGGGIRFTLQSLASADTDTFTCSDSVTGMDTSTAQGCGDSVGGGTGGHLSSALASTATE
jgi:hypothetical protein